MLFGVFTVVGQRPAAGAVTAMKGSACGYLAKIGLAGGFQASRGCGQPSGAPATAASPSVTLPAGGSAAPITATDSNGAKAVFGSTTFFGGMWPEDLFAPPPSGPLTVATQGSPEAGSVTSSADITTFPQPLPVRCAYDELGDTNCEAYGGFGPPPVEGESLHVECQATEAAVSGTTQIVGGYLTTSTDEYGSPLDGEAIPSSPPVNYTRSGVITNQGRNLDTPGDVLAFTVVFNQQIRNGDGSITVNGMHMYLFGPNAVGEVVGGQVTCGTTPHPSVPIDTVAPTCGTTVIQPWSPEDPSPVSPLSELIGSFDAGGLQSISNIEVINGTVQVGQPASSPPYLRFTPGQTGPLTITATRTQEAEDEGLPMYWSFDAVDTAGNTTRCRGLEPAVVADDDTYSTKKGTALTVTAPGVLVNDTTPRSTPLTATRTGLPANGTVTLNANGSFTYTPSTTTFSGTDSFTYLASDGRDSDSATVTIIVTAAPANADGVSEIAKSAGSDSTYPVLNDLALAFNESQGCEAYSAIYGGGPDFEPSAALTCAPDASQPASTVVTENHDHDVIANYFPTGSTDGFRQLCRREATSVQNIQFARSSSSPNVQAPNCTTANGGDSGTVFRWVSFAAENLGWARWSGGHAVSNLSVAQLQAIFVYCTITNWSQVGGPNEPIRVFAPQLDSGSLATWQVMLGGNPTNCIPAAFKDGNPANGERLVREHQAIDVEVIDTAAEAVGLGTCAGEPGCATADLEQWSIFASFSCAVWNSRPANKSASLMGNVAGSTCTSASHPGRRNLYNVFAQSPGAGYPGTSSAVRRFTDMRPVFPPANPTVNGYLCMPLSKHSKPPDDVNPGTALPGASKNYGMEKQAVLKANGFTLHKDDPGFQPGGVSNANDKPFCKQAEWQVNATGPMTFTGTNLGLVRGS